MNVNLEIIETKFSKLFLTRLSKKNYSFYWNKVYEPDYLKFDEYLSNNFKNNNINFKIFKGNALNEIHEIKTTEHLLKYSRPFGEMQKNIISRKYHQKKK